MRRHAQIETVDDNDEAQRFRIRLSELPEQVPYRSLTLEASVPAAWCRDPRVVVDGRELAAELVRPGVLRVTTLVHDGTQVEIRVTPRP